MLLYFITGQPEFLCSFPSVIAEKKGEIEMCSKVPEKSIISIQIT